MVEVNPQQYDNTCYIVAGGPSLKTFDWSLLTPDKFVVAINRAYEVLPNAQIIYFTDRGFWDVHRQSLLEHRGQLMRGFEPASKEQPHPDVIPWRLVQAGGIQTEAGTLSHGHNSTYAATNLAGIHLGFKRIYLLGVDMKWGKEGDKSTSHWHDGHSRIDAESVYTRMMKSWQTMVDPIAEHGVEVFNTNPNSALKCFPMCSVEQALANKGGH